jgi:hypothetical protein
MFIIPSLTRLQIKRTFCFVFTFEFGNPEKPLFNFALSANFVLGICCSAKEIKRHRRRH